MSTFYAVEVQQFGDGHETVCPVDLWLTPEAAKKDAEREWAEVYNDGEDVVAPLVWTPTQTGEWVGRADEGDDDCYVSFHVYPMTVKG